MKEYFDEEFQFEAVKTIMENGEVMPSIYKILDQNAFQNRGLVNIVGVMKDYFKKNGYVPDEVSLRILLRDKAINDDDYAESISSLMMCKNASSMGMETIKDSIIKFFQAKSLVKVANTILESAKTNEPVEKMVKKARKAFDDIYVSTPEGEVMTTINTETVKSVIMESEDESIPTGIDKLDELLVGGLGRKEIGLFVAPTGYGKTTAGTIFAHNAALKGYKVVQFYFEDKPEDIIRKHMAMTLNTNTRLLRGLDEYRAERTIESAESTGQMKVLNDNLIMYKLEVGTTTVEDIEMRIRKLITEIGFKPDMVVIDYFSCLRMSTNAYKKSYEAEADAMRKIKELSFKYNIAIWVMQQTNRQGVSKDGDSDTMGNWQGSFAATQPASVWLLLKRTKEQKENFRADIIFLKTRHSQPKNDLKNIVFDNAKLQIDCDDADDGLEWSDEKF